MTEKNIKKGFESCGIWPLDDIKMSHKMAPSECFRHADEDETLVSPGVEQLQLELEGLVVQDVTDDNVILETQPDSFQQRQYFVAEIPDEEGNFVEPDNGNSYDNQETTPPASSGPPNIMSFLSLPEHVVSVPRDRGDQPYVDYSKSI